MNFLGAAARAIFLFPLSVFYAVVVWIRNRLYDVKILSSREFAIPVISVGNITVGGTGKTIHVEYLLKFLKENQKVAMLSRGYMRRTSGFFMADSASNYKEIGDEPRQIKQKFSDVIVAVDKSRRRGIEKILASAEGVEAIVLDDAYQHRKVTPGLSILLIDYNQPLDKDFILPYGRMRESSHERKRADIIIVTKVPADTKPIELRILEKQVKMFQFQKIYFTMLQHDTPIPVFPESAPALNPLNSQPYVLLVTGIVNAVPLKEHLGIFTKNIKHINYPDHYSFDALDMQHIIHDFNAIPGDNKCIITTEKDAMRLQYFSDLDEDIKKHMYYVPVEIEFLENQAENFKKQILQYVSINRSNNILHQKHNQAKARSGYNSGVGTGWIDKSYRR